LNNLIVDNGDSPIMPGEEAYVEWELAYRPVEHYRMSGPPAVGVATCHCHHTASHDRKHRKPPATAQPANVSTLPARSEFLRVRRMATRHPATLSQTQDCLFASDDIPGNGAQAPSSKKP
jgi:hypothetical protein